MGTVQTRITSIDALRGLTVAFMILVNDPGDWGHVYWPLDHAEWNGFTPTDLVFPTFVFLVGCSIVFSVQSRVARSVPRATIALQMLRRAILIFALKMFLSAYPHFHLTHLRIFGVLTRIALCYLAAGLIFLYVRSVKAIVAITALILVGYWVLLRFVPISALGLPVRDFPFMDPERNLTAFIDRGFSAWCLRTIHMGRLYQGTRDPEGLLSTLPAIATSLLGILAALWMRRHQGKPAFVRNGLVLAGAISLLAALAWNPWFPINKNLWTSTFVLCAGGLSLMLLGLFYWLLDDLRLESRSRIVQALITPCLIFGSNAIAAFLLSELLVETLSAIKLAPDAAGHRVRAWGWLYTHLFAFHGSTENTSLAFAIAYVAVCFIPIWLLWRRRIFLRL